MVKALKIMLNQAEDREVDEVRETTVCAVFRIFAMSDSKASTSGNNLRPLSKPTILESKTMEAVPMTSLSEQEFMV